jgi:cytochrome c-type biogenesis protein CcmE
MTGFYIRWALIMGGALLLGILTYQDYHHRLTTVPFQAIVHKDGLSSDPVRIQGMVESGTLAGDLAQGQATFEFTADSVTIPVIYEGPPPENLRELKILVFKGRWDPQEQVFRAQDAALLPNYGFVAAAYLISFLVLAWMVFAMNRRVMVLFKEVKESKLYESEVDSLAKKQ